LAWAASFSKVAWSAPGIVAFKVRWTATWSYEQKPCAWGVSCSAGPSTSRSEDRTAWSGAMAVRLHA
jgi:hypothetical protein